MEKQKTLAYLSFKIMEKIYLEEKKKVSIIQCKKGNKESGKSTSCIMGRSCMLFCKTLLCRQIGELRISWAVSSSKST